MKGIQQKAGTGTYLDATEGIVAPRGPVGVVAATATGLQEVICLLARQEAGISRALVARGGERGPGIDAVSLEAGLGALQADPSTEIVLLVSQKLGADDAGRILDRVRGSDKPAVVCMVGEPPHHAWKAGALPATRLDEAAMRAAAWIRGWDQALVSSWLEEESEGLAERAAGLKGRLGAGQRGICGVVTDRLLAQEATLVLGAAAGSALPSNVVHVALDPAARAHYLNAALADPAVASIFVDLWIDVASDPDPARSLSDLVKGRGAPHVASIVAHVGSTDCDLKAVAGQEAVLREMGVAVVASNASAAWLAGLIVRDPA